MLNKNKSKRIGIDARLYGPVGKGLGRYTQEIVDNVIKLDKHNQYVIFLTKENFDRFQTDNPNVKKILTDVRWYSLKEQLVMPWLFIKERLNLVHFTHFNAPLFYPGKFVVTIHDLIVTRFPDQRATTLNPIIYKIKHWFYGLVIWSAVKRAKKIIAVSEFTKNDIREEFKVNSDKITVTYEGVPSLAKKGNKEEADLNDKKLFLRYNMDEPFLLYVGNAYPHKNLERLINSFSKIRENYKNLSLLLVGKEDYFYKKIKDYTIRQNLYKEGNKDNPVKFLGYVPDNNLKILYRKAVAFVFASYYEGFGLPPLEAMSNGCPVASSNRASLPEILGQAAVYFNPEDENEMQKQIETIIGDEKLRRELIAKGHDQIRKYSWTKCANETLNVYRIILKKH